MELLLLLGLGLLIGGAAGGGSGSDGGITLENEPEDLPPRDSFDAGTQAILSDEIAGIVTDLFDELEAAGDLDSAERAEAEAATTILTGPLDVATGADPDLIFGGSGDDMIDAGKGADLVFGGPGDDIILLGDGLDEYGIENTNAVPAVDPSDPLAAFSEANIEAGDDWVRGGKGADIIADGFGSDRLAGNEGGDLINAVDQDAGNPDEVLGGFGFDTLVVDEGDTVSTGDGKDTVVGFLRSAIAAGYDPIEVTDFNRSDDMIQIEAPAAELGPDPMTSISIVELADGSGAVIEFNGVPIVHDAT